MKGGITIKTELKEIREEVKYHALIEDIMFKFIFGYSKNIHYTEYLLEVLFNLKLGSLKDTIEIGNSKKLNKTKYKDKVYELDVKVDFKEQELIINLEAYTKFDTNAKYKSASYLNRIFSTSLKEGEQYEKIKCVLQINFVKGNTRSDIYTLVSLINPKKYLLDKGYYFLVINIDDMKELEYNLIKEVKELIGLNIYKEENHQEKLKRLLKFMGEKDEEKVLKIIKKDKVLKNMYESMKEFIDGEYSKGYFSAKRFHIGMGIEEGKIDVAKNMLLKGEDISYINEITKLPIEDIKELEKEIKKD